MGETRVDLLHLLEDLRDAYPGALEETILTEIVANALDSGASRIRFDADAAAQTFTVVDDGAGMTRAQLRKYHDLATSSKTRGKGIGFAGVGIKLALLVADEVVTETRRGKVHVASTWHLGTRYKAPWKWVEPSARVAERGTAVMIRAREPLSPLLDPGYIEATLVAHFQPLFEPEFRALLDDHYPNGVRFAVNGRELAAAAGPLAAAPSERAPIAVRLGRKRKPAAVGWVARSAATLPPSERGIAVSTLGKVIRRGWDWVGLIPAAGDRVTGLIEAPGLAEALQLNKADFIKSGARGGVYLAYRKAIQEAVNAQLAAWGDAAEPSAARRPRTRSLERDVRNVVEELADDFPLLAALVERRSGGQRRLPIGAGRPEPGEEWSPAGALSAGVEGDDAGVEPAGAEPASPGGETSGAGAGTEGDDSTPPAGDDAAPPAPPSPAAAALLPGARTRRRPAQYRLAIAFETREHDPALARLTESTIWVNDAHPAYKRAVGSRSEGYHLALCVAMALAPLAVEPARAHDFVTSFLTRWGEEGAGKRNGRRRS